MGHGPAGGDAQAAGGLDVARSREAGEVGRARGEHTRVGAMPPPWHRTRRVNDPPAATTIRAALEATRVGYASEARRCVSTHWACGNGAVTRSSVSPGKTTVPSGTDQTSPSNRSDARASITDLIDVTELGPATDCLDLFGRERRA